MTFGTKCGTPSLYRFFSRIDSVLGRHSSLALVALLVGATIAKCLVISLSDGGSDLLYSDIPKSLLLFQGKDPYSVSQWDSPYPPFLLAIVGGILWVASGGQLISGVSVVSSSLELRTAGLIADLLIAFLLFFVLRFQGFSGIALLVPVGLYLFLPPIGLLPYSIFHADIFGRLMMTLGLSTLVLGRSFVGTVLLALSAVFKVHPLLALLLVLIWLVRLNGLVRTLPTLTATGTIILLGLVLPFFVPGYASAFVGYNLSIGFGNGTLSFSLLNLFYVVLPTFSGLNLSTPIINVIWIASTSGLFLFAGVFVWKRSDALSAIDIVLLGLLVWLIPLRELYDWYVIWAVIPFLMRGRLLQSVVICGLLEVANILSGWAFNIPGNPFPVMRSVYGFFAISLLYAFVNVLALKFVLARRVPPRKVDLNISSKHESFGLV